MVMVPIVLFVSSISSLWLFLVPHQVPRPHKEDNHCHKKKVYYSFVSVFAYIYSSGMKIRTRNASSACLYIFAFYYYYLHCDIWGLLFYYAVVFIVTILLWQHKDHIITTITTKVEFSKCLSAKKNYRWEDKWGLYIFPDKLEEKVIVVLFVGINE